jgi:2-polyprenyl-6-methoxyphenol hydroxylase-like FAD-dependent oxidoreductase
MTAERVPVLIVGAGPVGLATACALWRLGVPARIVEAAAEAGLGSRAVQLHPPTLRLFRELGIMAEAEESGLRIRSTAYHLAGGRVLRVGLGAENEPLMLPQQQTSALLERALERLGGKVERSTTVTSVTLSEGAVTASVVSGDQREEIHADWLVAADGVRSPVRAMLGIAFEGSPVLTKFLLAEGRLDGDVERDAVHYFLGRSGSVVFASMPGDRIRVSAPVADDHPLTPEGVQRLIDERGPGTITVTDLDMVVGFTSQECVAATLRAGRCFLVGDAAHTHSPLGGQGLNLGLQDSHNLAWKLAGVITGKLNPVVLDGYSPERRRAAGQIVRITHRLLAMFTLPPLLARLRNELWTALDRLGVLRRWFVPLLAGWRVSYPDARPALPGLPGPGRRPPHRFAEVLDDGFGLVTSGPGRRAAELARRWPELVTHRRVRPGKRWYARRTVLLRPDGYVAAVGLRAAGRYLGSVAPAETGKQK